MHNYICQNCGTYLDPGEKCECQEEIRTPKGATDKTKKEESHGEAKPTRFTIQEPQQHSFI